MMRGGGQERGARAGTENVAAIAGMAAARARPERRELGRTGVSPAGATASKTRSRAIAPDAIFFGARAERLAEYLVFRASGDRGPAFADVPRYRGRRGLVGLGLFVRQGEALACSGGDGRRAGVGGRRDPGQSRMEFDRGGLRQVRADASKRRSRRTRSRPKRTVKRRNAMKTERLARYMIKV